MSATADLAPVLSLLAQEIESVYDRVRELPVSPPVDVATLRQEVARRFPLAEAQPLTDVFRQAAELLRQQSLHVTHPRYFGLFNPTVHPSTIAADALVALVNPQVGGWSHGPAANEMERLALRHLASVLGFDPESTAAHFTSGGNEANHTAVLCALASAFPSWPTDGVRALPGAPTMYVSDESHHSFVKVARAVGIGTGALRHVPVDGRLRMRVDDLATMVATDRAAGRPPFLVVGTAGTTSAGAIDPLNELAAFAASESLWFHVDAAWGGFGAFVPRLRPFLEGMSRGDSLTWDAHKGLSVPLGAGAFFTRHPAVLDTAFGVSTGYIPATQPGGFDLYKTSMQWSRRFIGLKVLFALAEHGPAGMASLIERQVAMGDRLRQRLTNSGWRVVNDAVLPLVCFTHPGIGADQASTGALVARLLARGRAWISEVRLPDSGWALRACITSFRTDEGDLDVLMEELETALGATTGG